MAAFPRLTDVTLDNVRPEPDDGDDALLDDPLALELLRLNRAWASARSRPERQDIWQRMLEINADQVYSIGLIGSVPQPVVVNKDLRNLPDKGIYNWNPGAHFGIYRPDTFWFDNAERRQAQR